MLRCVVRFLSRIYPVMYRAGSRFCLARRPDFGFFGLPLTVRRSKNGKGQTQVDFLIDDDQCLRLRCVRMIGERILFRLLVSTMSYHQPGNLIHTMNKLEMYVNAGLCMAVR